MSIDIYMLDNLFQAFQPEKVYISTIVIYFDSFVVFIGILIFYGFIWEINYFLPIKLSFIALGVSD